MNPFRRAVAKALGTLFAKAAGVNVPFDAMNHEMVRYAFGNVSTAGKSVTPDSMLGISAAWCCQRVLAETIAALPRGIYRVNGDNAELAYDHPLHELLVVSPNTNMTEVEYFESKVFNLAQQGNTYSFIDRLGKRITSLTPIESRLCTPKVMKPGESSKLALNNGDVFYRISDRGREEDFPQEKIWHVKGFGSNGLVGLSPIGAAREAMGGALAAEEFGNRFFSQGGKPAGTITIDKWLDEKQRKIARENLQNLMSGLGNAHKFVLLEGGMKPEPFGGMPLEDMQYILVRRFGIEEVCRFYRMPLHLVISPVDKGGWAALEQLSREFVTYTLMPYFRRFSASAAKWLLPPGERGEYILRFDFEDLIAGDLNAQREFFASALQNGYLNRNEVRAKLKRNRVDGLDDYTVQVNLTPVDRLNDIVDKQTEPAPKPTFSGQPGVPAAAPAAPPAPKMLEFKEIDVDGLLELVMVTKRFESVLREGLDQLPSHLAVLRKTLVELRQETDQRTAAFRELVEEMSKTFGSVLLANESALAGQNEEHAAHISEARRAVELAQRALEIASGPRKAVFDDKGEPIGTVPVKSMEELFNKE